MVANGTVGRSKSIEGPIFSQFEYAEELATGKVIKNDLSFRQLCEFKLARMAGKFKEIGVE